MIVQKTKECHFEIIWLKKQWKSYKEIVEITWYKLSKIKYHLLLARAKKDEIKLDTI